MAKTYQNIYGRRGSRGIRPWLLVPKVIAVGIFLGSLVCTAVVWFAHSPASGGSAASGASSGGNSGGLSAIQLVEHVSIMFRFLVVPALLMAMILGIMLFLQHPRQFSRLRWWQVKLVTIIIAVPCAHYFMSSRLALLRQAAADQTVNEQAHWQLSVGMVTLILGAVWLIILGRLKPRLGQNWARVYQKINAKHRGLSQTAHGHDPTATADGGSG